LSTRSRSGGLLPRAAKTGFAFGANRFHGGAMQRRAAARRRAAPRVCRDNADREVELCRSRLKAPVVARDLVREVFRLCERPLAKSRFA